MGRAAVIKKARFVWTEKANKVLQGRTIEEVRYMTPKEMKLWAWYEAGIVIVFDDESWIVVAKDDEGNGPGSLHTSHEHNSIIPSI